MIFKKINTEKGYFQFSVKELSVISYSQVSMQSPFEILSYIREPLIAVNLPFFFNVIN